MKTRILLRQSLILLLAAGLGVAAAEKEKPKEHDQPAAKESKEGKEGKEAKGGKEAEHEESRVKRLPSGEMMVSLDEEMQKKMGVELAHLAATNMTPEFRAFGRVLDPAQLVALVNDLMLADTALKLSQAELARAQKAGEVEIKSATATALASKQELERTKVLKERDNASVRALQAAEAAAKRDELAVQTAKFSAERAAQAAEAATRRDQLAAEMLHRRALVTWGKALLDQRDLPGLSHSLVQQERALVRLELPAGVILKAPPRGARLVTLGSEATPAEGELLGPAPAVDPQTQGQAWFFLVKDGAAGLPANAAVTGHLKMPGDPVAGVIIPRTAIVRTEGAAWVYLETGEEKFTRKAVTLDHATAAGWFVTGGFTEKDEVVTTGAQVLLSEEMKPAGKD